MARARKEVLWDWPVDYAKHRGVSRQAVHKAIAEGRIELVQGRINREIADREWAANTTDSGSAAGGPGAAASPRTGAGGASDPTPRLSYNEARTAWQWYRARIAQLDYEERAARLVDAEKVKQAAFEQARRLQEKIMAIPDGLGPIIAMKPRAECTRILQLALRQALEEAAGPAKRSPAAAKAS